MVLLYTLQKEAIPWHLNYNMKIWNYVRFVKRSIEEKLFSPVKTIKLIPISGSETIQEMLQNKYE